MPALRIIWSKQAKESLKGIFDYYKDKSLQGAKNVRADLLQTPKKIIFAKQYQKDDINPKYYRIIVREYKILYLEEGNRILIIDIFSTRQSPDILASK
ncbi:type II toxin-antitoxin system RelE/ParE family toxin [Algoriphagus sp. Y33]|uniref:type II toxin-antitoxin system RelE/ParE family toxin n=1 Tax=Algoriphagus sp. Y33 TaxID=2772483 RepID=UPI00177B28F2|nr:type II toxin-antitoxin system RelE/ParE family toxin [Algoriphagus sp. Y33]